MALVDLFLLHKFSGCFTINKRAFSREKVAGALFPLYIFLYALTSCIHHGGRTIILIGRKLCLIGLEVRCANGGVD